MKSLITTLLAIGIVAPASSAYALSVNDIIDMAKNGSGVSVESHASVSSGGQTAAAGESVSTGDVSASSHIETHINDGQSGGSVQVHVETTQNGETKTEEYSKAVAPGESVHVEVGTSSASGNASVDVQVHAPAGTAVPARPASATSSTSRVPLAATSAAAHAKLFFSFKIPDFFKKIFGFFIHW